MAQFLEIKLYRDLKKNILPKIDALAAEQNRTRSDIIRDILYASFDYTPFSCSPEQVNEDHIEERQKENNYKYPCIEVRVDGKFRWMFFEYILSLPGGMDNNYRRCLNRTLYEYFGIEVPKLLK